MSARTLDLTGADVPASYFVVPVQERPAGRPEVAPYDLDVLRLDFEREHGRGNVWTPFRAGEVIPAAIAQLPRRSCPRTSPACPHFSRLGQVLVQSTAVPRCAA